MMCRAVKPKLKFGIGFQNCGGVQTQAHTVAVLRSVWVVDAIVNINLIHIAAWSACLGLMSGARKILPVGGILYLYGPFKQGGNHTADSNADFDASLRSQNPEWGVRDLEAVVSVAEAENFSLLKIQPMPANNLSVIFQASN
jgi:hypothetical protein